EPHAIRIESNFSRCPKYILSLDDVVASRGRISQRREQNAPRLEAVIPKLSCHVSPAATSIAKTTVIQLDTDFAPLSGISDCSGEEIPQLLDEFGIVLELLIHDFLVVAD